MQRPIPRTCHVLAAAAVRLGPLAVGHLASRRVYRNQAVANTLEQHRSFLAPVVSVSREPRNDVVAALGFQVVAFWLLRRAHFPLARATGAGASAAMLTE